MVFAANREIWIRRRNRYKTGYKRMGTTSHVADWEALSHDVAVRSLSVLPYTTRWAIMATSRRFREVACSEEFRCVRQGINEILPVWFVGVQRGPCAPFLFVDGRWRRGPECPVASFDVLPGGVVHGEGSLATFDLREWSLQTVVAPEPPPTHWVTLARRLLSSLPMRVVMVGDDQFAFVRRTSCGLFRLVAGEWHAVKSTYYPRHVPELVFTHDRHIYFLHFTGHLGDTSLRVYDVDSDSWMAAPVPATLEITLCRSLIPHWRARCVALHRTIFFFFNGKDDSEQTRCVIATYDVLRQFWTVGSVAPPRAGAHFEPLLFDGSMFAFSTWNDNADDKCRVWRYVRDDPPPRDDITPAWSCTGLPRSLAGTWELWNSTLPIPGWKSNHQRPCVATVASFPTT